MPYSGVFSSIGSIVICPNAVSIICNSENRYPDVDRILPDKNNAKIISSENIKTRKFTYGKVLPSLRGSKSKPMFIEPQLTMVPPMLNEVMSRPVSPISTNYLVGSDMKGLEDAPSNANISNKEGMEKGMTRLELIKDKNWRERVQFLTDQVLKLKPGEFVGDILEKELVQMVPTDYCFLVKWVGKSNWHRALEIYEWSNLQNWYYPNERMLSILLGVLGKANQESLAAELFSRVEPAMTKCRQVYNAMMGVYARNGRFNKVQELLDLMHERGCEPDLVSFNTLINARIKAGILLPNSALTILKEVRICGLRPDTVTYNTLISACSHKSYLEDAVKIYNDMEAKSCQPDLWTYNAMLSVYGKCGLSRRAEQVFSDLQLMGFAPDAVTYNSLLYAFAKEGNINKVTKICRDMVKMGFSMDEMTYNTIIHMYGKRNQHETALRIYREMKMLGKKPDAVTFNILIGSLARANKMEDAEDMIAEMLEKGVKPTLETLTIMISCYAKAGKRVEAEEAFTCMLRSGFKPDQTAYSVMLDTFPKFNEAKKAINLYRKMVRDSCTPDIALYKSLLQLLAKGNLQEDIVMITDDVKKIFSMETSSMFSFLVKSGCYDNAANFLKSSSNEKLELNHDDLFLFLNSYIMSNGYSEALNFLHFLRQKSSISDHLVTEALVFLHSINNQLDIALTEYRKLQESGSVAGSLIMYESLIQHCEENKLFTEASQVFYDMRTHSLRLSAKIYTQMISVYCNLDIPKTAHHILNLAESSGLSSMSISHYSCIIKSYCKLKKWEEAESFVYDIKKKNNALELPTFNALMECYARGGCYDRANGIFKRMVSEGPSPSVDTVNFLLRSLVTDGRLNELHTVIKELQALGFTISKSSIILMLEAFSQTGNVLEVKRLYQGMKAAGYIPSLHVYKIIIECFCNQLQVGDSEAVITDMEQNGYKPNISIMNARLRMFVRSWNFNKAYQVYEQIKMASLESDELTYNSLLMMYCRECKPVEGLSIMHKMRMVGLNPELNCYKSLIHACGKKKLWQQAEEIFNDLQLKEYKLDIFFYHTMLKIYRNMGNYKKAEGLVNIMKSKGVEFTIMTMHLLIVTYGMSGQPQKAEDLLNNLKTSSTEISTILYSSVIDSYLKAGNHTMAIGILNRMQSDGVKLDHRISTCFIRAASLTQHSSEAITFLSPLKDAGFGLPMSLLLEKYESVVGEVEDYLRGLEYVEHDEALSFLNALEDLLWAFEMRASAAEIFELAIRRNIYHHNIFRVADKDWGADFRRLSTGAALVGLTSWLSHMQAASLQGSPLSPKSVVLKTGLSEYNGTSVSRALKTHLWEMESPFLPCQTNRGRLVAKSTTLRMWLKESPMCRTLELENVEKLPQVNSMQLVDGCFVRRGLAPVFMDIIDKIC